MGHAPYVDAGRARAHVQKLLGAGMTVRQVEAVSGVHRTAIRVMLGDFPGRKQSKQIRAATERALLRVRANPAVAAGTATVDAIGTRRRLQALRAAGYPGKMLAQMLGAGPNSPLQVARADRVRASTARKVADLYAELENTTGPSRCTAVVAQAKGFLPPAWWDEDTIDDSTVEASGLREYRPSGLLLDDPSAPRLARIELLLRRGLSRQEIADRLGVPLRYVTRDLQDTG
jgi:hypothetical protein